MKTPPSCTPGLNVFQRLIAHDNRLRLKNQAQLRDLKRQAAGRIRLFSRTTRSSWSVIAPRPERRSC